MRFTDSIKQKWADLLLGDFTPHTIAFGLSIGTFIALLPTFGFSILLALLFIFIFPKVNRPAVFLALLVWNPIIQIPIYTLSFQLGSFLYEGATLVKYDVEILNQLYSFTRRFLVAHMIITTTLTVLVYISSYTSLKYWLFRKVSDELANEN